MTRLNDDGEALERIVRDAFRGTGIPAERLSVSSAGLYFDRDAAVKSDQRDCLRKAIGATEAAFLELGHVRILDFNRDRKRHVEAYDPKAGPDVGLYAGVRPSQGNVVFRIDHHFDPECFSWETTTSLVRQWLKAVHGAGRHDLIAQFSGSRYIADHADTDILLANFLATVAGNRNLIEGKMGEWFVGASRVNDYGDLPDDDAMRVYYACLAMDKSIQGVPAPVKGLRFEEALKKWLPALEAWLNGSADGETGRSLDSWAEAMKQWKEESQRKIGDLVKAGHLSLTGEGRIAVLEAPGPKSIDNIEAHGTKVWVEKAL